MQKSKHEVVKLSPLSIMAETVPGISNPLDSDHIRGVIRKNVDRLVILKTISRKITKICKDEH